MSLVWPPVNLNESVISAGAPSRLQQVVTYVSFGATTADVGSRTLVTGSSSFNSKLAANSWLTSAISSFYSMGTGSFYVLELGVVGSSTQAALLKAYLDTNPLVNYLYVLGAEDSASAGISALVSQYDSETSYTYFLLTLTATEAAAYSSDKAVITFVPSASAPSTEFGASAIAYMFANTSPSAAARIQPFNFRFVTGFTPYANPVSSTALSAVSGLNTNIIVPATAGGLTNDMLLGGQCSDGRSINHWYGPDYTSLQATQSLTNEMITGANLSDNPLIYNQDGINRLRARVVSELTTCIAVGAIIGPVAVNAVDFDTYALAYPDDFEGGIYNGISFTVTPARGFAGITYNMTVDFTGASVAISAQ